MATPLVPSQSQLLAALQQQWQLGLLALLPVLLVSSYLLLTSRARGSGAPRLPPGPTQVPVLGNLHLLGPLPHQNLRDLSRRHSAVMLLRLGTVATVVVSSAAAAREVMKAHDVDCCSRPVSPGPKRLSYDLMDVAFAPYDEYWREMRKLFIVELLSMRRVKAAWYAREEQVSGCKRAALQTARPPPLWPQPCLAGLAGVHLLKHFKPASFCRLCGASCKV